MGVTHQKPANRLSKHLSYARTRRGTSHLVAWLRKLLSDGIEPTLSVITSGLGLDWGVAERSWIQQYRDQGFSLVNATDGGEGCPGHTVSAEARERIAAGHRGKPLSAEHRAKVSAANKGKKNSPEAIAKTTAAWIGRKHTAESRAKMSAARLGKEGPPASAEAIAKRVASSKARRAEPGYIDPRLGRALSSETRAMIGVANKGTIRTPEARTRMSEARKKLPQETVSVEDL